MIIEFFGLASTGKSFLKSRINNKDFLPLNLKEISFKNKVMNFLKYLIKNPISTTRLFWILNSNHPSIKLPISKRLKLLKMRNSYLAFVLAKDQIVKKYTRPIIMDEFSLQSLFMILNRKSNQNEIKKIMDLLPGSSKILILKKSKNLRNKTYSRKHKFRKSGLLMPGSQISNEYAKEFMKVMEHNFEIIESIIKEKYKETENPLKLTINKMPLKYRKQILISAYGEPY